jgi:hypothetical protein
MLKERKKWDIARYSIANIIRGINIEEEVVAFFHV